MKLQGARCFVTGGTKGIGRALALSLAKKGAVVYAGARGEENADALRSAGVHFLRLDVTDAASVDHALEAAREIDILFNNAGLLVAGAIEEIGDDDLVQQYETNVFAPWRLCRAVLPGMRERGSGAIVNMCSIGGELAYPGLGAYRSSKHALKCLSWTLHFEVAHFGIRILNIEPGTVDTDFSTKAKRFGVGVHNGSPYAPMRAQADAVYKHIAPTRTDPQVVATQVIAELEKDNGPVDLTIGRDAEQMLALARAGRYESGLVTSLGFEWHPLDPGA